MGRVHICYGEPGELSPHEFRHEHELRVLVADEPSYDGELPMGLAFYNVAGRLLIGMRWDSGQRVLVEVDREEVARWLA